MRGCHSGEQHWDRGHPGRSPFRKKSAQDARGPSK
jgi:hypothetical protein